MNQDKHDRQPPSRWPALAWNGVRRFARERAGVGWTGPRVFVVMALAAAAAVAGLIAFAPEPEIVAVEENAFEVSTMAAEPRAISPELRLFGRVETPRVSSLASALAAEVAAVPAVEGQQVSRGDVLVVLDAREAELTVAQRAADVEEARAAVASLRLAHRDDEAMLGHQRELLALAIREVERHKELRHNSAVSETLLDTMQRQAHQQAIALRQRQGAVENFANRIAQTEARLRRSEALLAEAELALERTWIRSPYDGRISRVAVAPGERVAPGTVVVDVYDTAALEVRAQLPGRDLAVIRRALGRPGEASLTARLLTDPPMDATLDRLSGQVESGVAGVDGLFRVHGGSNGLEVGRIVELELALPPAETVVAAPEQAIYGEDRVYLVEDGRLRGVTIERVGRVADADGSRILIRSPELEAGSRILVTQLGNAMTGLRVASSEPEASIGGFGGTVAASGLR